MVLQQSALVTDLAVTDLADLKRNFHISSKTHYVGLPREKKAVVAAPVIGGYSGSVWSLARPIRPGTAHYQCYGGSLRFVATRLVLAPRSTKPQQQRSRALL
jgi:hypothetical protein